LIAVRLEANFREILPLLVQHKVDFILIGGGAATVHGLSRTTFDVGVVYARDEANLQRLVSALEDHAPYLRGAPPGLPFRWDLATLKRGLNFTLTTDLGNLDLLGEVAGGGDFARLLPHTHQLTVFGITCPVVTLSMLIHLKRAAGRPKDIETIAQLEALREERDAAEGERDQ
jgi:hypothetical protein